MQREKDRLCSQVEKRRDLDERDTQDSGQAKHPVVCVKGKKPIALDDVDTRADDELSSGSLLNPSLVKGKSNEDRSRQRHSHHPAFSNSNGSTFHRATSRGQNQPNEVPGNAFTLPTGTMPIQLVYHVFEEGSALYMPPITAIRGPNDILSLPLGQHILDYEPPRGFIMPTFAV